MPDANEIIAASQIHAVMRPVQLRFSSQPMGLRSSERRIQRRKSPVQNTGRKKKFSTSVWRLVFGLSSQLRRKTLAAKSPHKIRNNSANSEKPRVPAVTARIAGGFEKISLQTLASLFQSNSKEISMNSPTGTFDHCCGPVKIPATVTATIVLIAKTL